MRYDPNVCPVIVRLAPVRQEPPRARDLMLFLPHDPANRGNIACWDPLSGHGEASLDFYHSTRPPWAFSAEALALVEEYRKLLASHGQTLRHLHRLTRDWRRYAWKN